MTLLDLSAPIRPDPPNHPQPLRTEIQFDDHAQGAAVIGTLFGVGPSCCATGRAGRPRRSSVSAQLTYCESSFQVISERIMASQFAGDARAVGGHDVWQPLHVSADRSGAAIVDELVERIEEIRAVAAGAGSAYARACNATSILSPTQELAGWIRANADRPFGRPMKINGSATRMGRIWGDLGGWIGRGGSSEGLRSPRVGPLPPARPDFARLWPVFACGRSWSSLSTVGERR
jgi:hypothetical protein